MVVEAKVVILFNHENSLVPSSVGSAFSFKEIFLKKDHHCRGGVIINSICYTIFSKLFCFALCSNPPL